MNDAVRDLIGVLVAARKVQGIKKSAVGERCNCPAWMVSAIERCEVDPTVSWLLEYADLVGFDLEWKLTGGPRDRPTRSTDDIMRDAAGEAPARSRRLPNARGVWEVPE